MILLVAGASHSGKTLLAQRLLREYGLNYISADHIKMGLIRSGMLALTPDSPDAELTRALWQVERGIIMTAVENGQSLTVEGCYIPAGYEKDLPEEYRGEVKLICLILSEKYIKRRFGDISAHACDIERRIDDSYCTPGLLIRDNAEWARICAENGYFNILIKNDYTAELEDGIRRFMSGIGGKTL